MVIDNTLHFMVPHSKPAFNFPVTASAAALDLDTIKMTLVVRENQSNQDWLLWLEMTYKGQLYVVQNTIPFHKVPWIPQAPEKDHIQMITAKRVVYGRAHLLAFNLAGSTDLKAKFLTECIQRFAKPDFNLKTSISGATPAFSIGGFIGDVVETASNTIAQEAEKLPQAAGQYFNCPAKGQEYTATNQKLVACNVPQMSLHMSIMHLNDGHKWTREQIADWLDKLYAEGVDLAFKDQVDA